MPEKSLDDPQVQGISVEIPNVSSGAPSSLLEFVQAYPFLHKGLGHLAAPCLLLLLVTHYELPYHKTIFYRSF